MWILCEKCLIQQSGKFDQDLRFMLNLIQIIIDIMKICYKPKYTHGTVRHIFLIIPSIHA
jgi:hypothetical protein